MFVNNDSSELSERISSFPGLGPSESVASCFHWRGSNHLYWIVDCYRPGKGTSLGVLVEYCVSFYFNSIIASWGQSVGLFVPELFQNADNDFSTSGLSSKLYVFWDTVSLPWT